MAKIKSDGPLRSNWKENRCLLKVTFVFMENARRLTMASSIKSGRIQRSTVSHNFSQPESASRQSRVSFNSYQSAFLFVFQKYSLGSQNITTSFTLYTFLTFLQMAKHDSEIM